MTNNKELALFIERQAVLWEDLETVEQECLSGNETLVDWLQEELLQIVKLYKKGYINNDNSV
jgi:hypothetical protein